MNFIKKTKAEINALADKKLSANLTMDEVKCKCGCGDLVISQELVDKFQKFRDSIYSPITIVSGYRCPKNIPEGSSNKSQHCMGTALDISMGRKKNLLNMFEIAIVMFKRVGLYYNKSGYATMHVDVAESAKLYWLCDRVNNKGRYVYFHTPSELLRACGSSKTTKWNQLLI